MCPAPAVTSTSTTATTIATPATTTASTTVVLTNLQPESEAEHGRKTQNGPERVDEPITAERMLRLFPDDIDTSVLSSRPSRPTVVSTSQNRVDRLGESDVGPASTDTVFDGCNAEQIRLMAEDCIVLDENDVAIGSASKKTCHLVANIDKGLLHRAFSVFLFDQQNRLLLQQRATEKITFPDMWTNTCCSHPLSIPGEMGTTFEDSIAGVKRAAQRKLEHELGIQPDQVPIDEFVFLTRIHYKAPCDDRWGEHEIDYILLIKPSRPISLDVNLNEVRDTAFVSQHQLEAMFDDSSLAFTPWFRLICQSNLFEWWNVVEKDGLDTVYLNERVGEIVAGAGRQACGSDVGEQRYSRLLAGVGELKRM